MVFADGKLSTEKVRLQKSALASQASGPPMNPVEMSYQGRTWPKLGKKMLRLRPLALQHVASDDSVLGPLSNSAGPGLTSDYTYLSMIQATFQPRYWMSTDMVDSAGAANSSSDFTQAEFNFALFWGIAIQAYQSTLVSDDTPFDRFSEGNTRALTSDEQNGLRVFRNSECTTCHAGPEFTTASYTSLAQNGPVQRRGGNGGNGLLDTGFFRTGVRPQSEDSGLGGLDDFGNPFSLAVAQNSNALAAVVGAFKTPTLRNVEFTGPYFHNGSQATLEQVIDFYLRGSDFPNGNLGPDIQRRNTSPADRQSLASFLRALTDDRVRYETAPFDHPELCVPMGAPETDPGILQLGSDPQYPLSAADRWIGLSAVGGKGNSVPLQTFNELSAGTGSDGTRTHTMTEACSIPTLRAEPASPPATIVR